LLFVWLLWLLLLLLLLPSTEVVRPPGLLESHVLWLSD